MKVDGKALQDKITTRIRQELEGLSFTPSLAIIYAGRHPVIDTYVDLKKQMGSDLGIETEVIRLADEAKLTDLRVEIQKVIPKYQGLIVQLPLPNHIDAGRALDLIPPEVDVDVLSSRSRKRVANNSSPVLPPVVGAIREIIEHYDVNLKDKKVAVVGHGRLVGKPVSAWLTASDIPHIVLEKGDDLERLADMDIIISGAGVANLITPVKVKRGVVLIDAGTSSVSGETVGDIDLACQQKTSLFATVPGGVGPITVAKLFENLLILAKPN